MSKKEIKLIVAILFVALGIYVGVQIYNRLNVKTYGIVTYKNQVIHTFNVNKDEDYYFNGSYGKMKLEVKDDADGIAAVWHASGAGQHHRPDHD